MSNLESVPHVGKRFTSKLGRLLTSTIDTETRIGPLKAIAARTLEIELPIMKDSRADMDYRKLLIKHLNLAGADNVFVESAVSATELHEEPIQIWDLFLELVSQAAWLHTTDREKVEQVAYQVLTHKLKVEEL